MLLFLSILQYSFAFFDFFFEKYTFLWELRNPKNCPAQFGKLSDDF